MKAWLLAFPNNHHHRHHKYQITTTTIYNNFYRSWHFEHHHYDSVVRELADKVLTHFPSSTNTIARIVVVRKYIKRTSLLLNRDCSIIHKSLTNSAGAWAEYRCRYSGKHAATCMLSFYSVFKQNHVRNQYWRAHLRHSYGSFLSHTLRARPRPWRKLCSIWRRVLSC